jgi:hypothetical protein
MHCGTPGAHGGVDFRLGDPPLLSSQRFQRAETNTSERVRNHPARNYRRIDRRAPGQCSGVEAQQRMRYTNDMQRWEYMTLDLVKRKNEIEELNALGREGWEAVAMVSSWGVGWRFVHPIVLLKRPRPNDAEGSPG